jgi:hypothetical protein
MSSLMHSHHFQLRFQLVGLLAYLTTSSVHVSPRLAHLAAKFDSAECRTAIKKENTTRWESLCSPQGPLCVVGGSQDGVVGSFNDKTSVVCEYNEA